MPGVDTIEALTAAVQAFDATPLGLQVDPDADAAVRQSCGGPAWCCWARGTVLRRRRCLWRS